MTTMLKKTNYDAEMCASDFKKSRIIETEF